MGMGLVILFIAVVGVPENWLQWGIVLVTIEAAMLWCIWVLNKMYPHLVTIEVWFSRDRDARYPTRKEALKYMSDNLS